MIISLIVAADQNNAIGYQNQIPWHLGTDLKMFKETTMGHHIIMGRKTYQSIGRLLPGRTSIVLTRQHEMEFPAGCHHVRSLDGALALARRHEETECFVIGGAQIFRDVFRLAERIYLTRVHTWVEQADTYLLDFDESEWNLVSKQKFMKSEHDEFAFTRKVLERRLD